MNRPSVTVILIAALTIFSVLIRFVGLDLFLPYYSLDENELTEFALGFFGPDKDPHWYKYGPLYWYILHGIYRIQAFFSELSGDEFVQQYFFNPNSYFLTSRYLSSILQILIAMVVYLFTYFHLNKKAALLAFGLAIFPLGDSLTNFLPRTDTLLGLCAVLCLFFGAFLIRKNPIRPIRYFTLCGVFFGLSIAAKPIPSLLILPALAILFYSYFADSKYDFNKMSRTLMKILSSKQIYLFLIASLVAFYIGDPYAFKSFDLFWQEQVQAITEEGSRNFASGASLGRFFGKWGVLLTTMAVLVTCWSIYDGFKRRKAILLSIGVYIITYWGLFALGAARDYFYVPITPMVCILIGYYLRRTLYQQNKKRAFQVLKVEHIGAICLIVFLAQPFGKMIVNRIPQSIASVEDHSQHVCAKWFKDNTEQNSSILYYGYYTSLPRLVDNDINENARYLDYFMYNRHKNAYWVEQYSKAFQRILTDKDQPKYDIIYNVGFIDDNNQKQNYYTRYRNDALSSNLFKLAKSQNIDFIASVYDISDQSTGYELIQKFDRSNTSYGPKINIYKREN